MDPQFSLDFSGEPTPERGPDPAPDGGARPLVLAAPALVAALAQVARDHPLERKRIVGRTRGEGRELLRSLARCGIGWVGFEPATLRPLAVECVGVQLGVAGLRLLDDFDVTARIDRAIDRVIVGKRGRFRELSEAVGFRRAVEQAVLALRMSGLSGEVMRRTPFDDREKREMVAAVLETYVRGLEQAGEVDAAGVFSAATSALESGEAASPPEDLTLLLPGLSARGHAGAFVAALRGRGAVFLADDPVVGIDPPAGVFAGRAGEPTTGAFLAAPSQAAHSAESGLHIDVFAATTVTAELREVLRRVVELRVSWDQVEILTPDARTYGSALHALSEALAVPVTFGVGLPVERSRPGRALGEFFRWIDSGFSAETIRGLLEAGDLRPAPEYEAVSAMDLARRFRELRVGWGRRRHGRRLRRRMDSLVRMTPGRHESREQMERRRTRVDRELRALDSILGPVLEALPDGIPDPSEGPNSAPVSPADLAKAASEFLTHVPPRDSVDTTASAALTDRLRRVSETWTRPTEYRAAAAIVRRALQIQIPAPRSEGRAPWGSTPGHLYFTDLEYAGLSNRPHTFLVGMDAGRFPGAGLQDPLLLDRERERLSPDGLATASAALKERVFAFYRAFSRMRGSITVSHATWEPSEARELAAAAEVLAVTRLVEKDPTLTFDGMRARMGPPVGAIPRDRVALDVRDVWLDTIDSGGHLLDARTLVDALYPGVRLGSQALAATASPEPSSHLGVVRARDELDPRNRNDQVLSASRLEHLGGCPRRYLYASALRLRPPDDPDYRPDRWLGPLARGDVLHRVFESTLRRGREEPDVELEVHAAQALDREIRRAVELHPTPSQEIQHRERQALREDVRSFLRLVDQRGAEWVALELKFGFDEIGPATIRLHPSGSILLRGAIDRLDSEGPTEPAVVIDYKTGSAYNAERDTGVFHGGRRLQNVLYTMAVHDLLERPVERMEYQYPTRRARNSVLEFAADDLRTGPFVLGRMLDGVAKGHFVPTDDPDDCRWCDFRTICRVREESSKLVSPPAQWTREWLKRAEEEPNALPVELRALRDVRREDAPAIVPPSLWQAEDGT